MDECRPVTVGDLMRAAQAPRPRTVRRQPVFRWFHYTSEDALVGILADGVIGPSPSGGDGLPAVVWLISDGTLAADRAESSGRYAGLTAERLAVCIEATTPARTWKRWADKCGMPKASMHAAMSSSSGRWRSWGVIERPIPAAEWRRVFRTVDGAEITRPSR